MMMRANPIRVCTYTFMQCIYPLKTALAGGQLSCGIFIFSCTDINIHCPYTVEPCSNADVRVFQKMLQESWPPARAFLRGYIHCIYIKANSCTIALSIPITKGVQARMNGIYQGNASDRERNCRFMVLDRMNCLIMNQVQTSIYIVHTLYKHVCKWYITYMFVYILAQSLSIRCIY